MARGQGDDHDPVPVSRDEVAGESAVEVVADARPVDQVDLRLRQEAQVACHGERDVLQCDAHLRTVAREGASAVRRQHGHGRVEAAGHVPRRQDVVHRELVPFGAGDHGEAGGGVDRVVHGRGPVVLALDLDVDQVRARREQATRTTASRARQRSSAAIPASQISARSVSRACGDRKSMVTDFLPLLRPAQ